MTVKWTIIKAGVHYFVLSCGHTIVAPDRPQRPNDLEYARCTTCEVEQ